MRETINFKAVLLAKMDESDLDNLANFNCVDEQDCTDAHRLEEAEIQNESCVYAIAPAVKIARLAVDKRFQGMRFGALLLDYIRDLCLDLSGSVGIRFVTLDAFPHRVSYYQKMGFRENQVYSRDKRRQFVSMRSDVYEVID